MKAGVRYAGGVGIAPPDGIITQKMSVPPTMVSGWGAVGRSCRGGGRKNRFYLKVFISSSAQKGGTSRRGPLDPPMITEYRNMLRYVWNSWSTIMIDLFTQYNIYILYYHVTSTH